MQLLLGTVTMTERCCSPRLRTTACRFANYQPSAKFPQPSGWGVLVAGRAIPLATYLREIVRRCTESGSSLTKCSPICRVFAVTICAQKVTRSITTAIQISEGFS